MKAISIQQPWAWAIVRGHKPVENRNWQTQYRGPLLIHAGRTFDRYGYDHIRRTFPDIDMPPLAQFECGGIVGRADLVACVNTHASPWFFGPYGFVLENAKALPFVACRGSLGMFIVPPEVLAELKDVA